MIYKNHTFSKIHSLNICSFLWHGHLVFHKDNLFGFSCIKIWVVTNILSIYRSVGSYATSKSPSHPSSNMLTHDHFLFLLTPCNTKWVHHSFLNK